MNRLSIFDRGLACLDTVEKVGCMYFSYANGLLLYVAEIAARTEQRLPYRCIRARSVEGAVREGAVRRVSDSLVSAIGAAVGPVRKQVHLFGGQHRKPYGHQCEKNQQIFHLGYYSGKRETNFIPL